MGVVFKLPSRECEDCGYHASGGAFRRDFGNFWFVKDKCPKCKSKNIKDGVRPVTPPMGTNPVANAKLRKKLAIKKKLKERENKLKRVLNYGI